VNFVVLARVPVPADFATDRRRTISHSATWLRARHAATMGMCWPPQVGPFIELVSCRFCSIKLRAHSKGRWQPARQVDDPQTRLVGRAEDYVVMARPMVWASKMKSMSANVRHFAGHHSFVWLVATPMRHRRGQAIGSGSMSDHGAHGVYCWLLRKILIIRSVPILP